MTQKPIKSDEKILLRWVEQEQVWPVENTNGVRAVPSQDHHPDGTINCLKTQVSEFNVKWIKEKCAEE